MEGSATKERRVLRGVASVLVLGLVAMLVWRCSQAARHGELPKQVTGSEASPVPVRETEASDRLSAAAKRPGARCEGALTQAFNHRARELSRRGDASSQLAYALAVPFDVEPDIDRMSPSQLQDIANRRQAESERAVLRAAALSPKQPGVLFVAAAQCGGGNAACRVVQQALLSAEPDNMAVWLMEMSWARGRNDPARERIAFERAAQATRYETHADTFLQAMVDGYGEAPLPVECSNKQERAALRRLTGMGHDFRVLDQALLFAIAGRALPAYNNIRRQCVPSTGAVIDAPRRIACQNIMGRMAEGDTLIERAVALDAMVQLLADTPGAPAWRERYREHQWMRAQMEDAEAATPMRPEDYVLEEVDAYQAVLEASGRWPPPANWMPSDPHARSLIQTGRPPPSPPR